MQGNDIGGFTVVRTGVMFDDLLATMPEKSLRERMKGKLTRTTYEDWMAEVRRWHFNDLPYKSVLRMQQQTMIEVYTFQPHPFAEALDSYLRNRNISPGATLDFRDAADLRMYLQGNLNVHTVFVGTEALGQIIGPRACVAMGNVPLVLS